jgi:hypothetical protein
MLGVLHLRRDGKKCWCAGKCEDDHRHGRHELRKTRLSYSLNIRSEVFCLWSSGRTVLKADGDGKGDDYETCQLLLFNRHHPQ